MGTPGAEVCNLGSGGGFSVRQVLDAAEAVVGRPIPRPSARAARAIHRCSWRRADRAAEVLDWRPAHPSLEEIVG